MRTRMGLVMAMIAMAALACYADDKECEERGKTGGGGLELGVLRLDMGPIEEIVRRDPVLSERGFDFRNNNFMTLGLTGFGGDRQSGGRVGFGGWVGYSSFFSKEYETVADSAYFARTGDSLVDSVDQLHVIVAYGGFLGEKSFRIIPAVNIYGGGLIGAGAQVAIRTGRASASAFREVSAPDTADSLSGSIDVAAAPIWAFDVHGGATYSFTSWMHMGVDAAVVMFYSSWGFGYGYGSFFTANPSFRVRLVFGNAV